MESWIIRSRGLKRPDLEESGKIPLMTDCITNVAKPTMIQTDVAKPSQLAIPMTQVCLRESLLVINLFRNDSLVKSDRQRVVSTVRAIEILVFFNSRSQK